MSNPADHVGEFLTRRRDSDDRPLTLAHRVQTRVNEVFTTQCGRDFYDWPNHHFLFEIETQARICKRCL